MQPSDVCTVQPPQPEGPFETSHEAPPRRRGPALLAGVVLTLVFSVALVFGIAVVLVDSAAADLARPPAGRSRAESTVMQELIDRQAGRLALAEACAARAERPQLRQHCDQVARGQHDDLQRVQAWLSGWYDLTHAPAAPDLTHLDALDGDGLELEVMRGLVLQAAGSLQAAERCLQQASHRELAQLCAESIRSQHSDVEQLLVWFCEWHQACTGAPRHEPGSPFEFRFNHFEIWHG
jgi:uncharacterized protein (DUF305 family)